MEDEEIGMLLSLNEAEANTGRHCFNLAQELEQAFGAWPSFAGLALHEVLMP